MRRSLVILVAAQLAACHGHASESTLVDAGRAPLLADPSRSAGPRPILMEPLPIQARVEAMRDRRTAAQPKTDPGLAACVSNSKTRAAFRACLRGLSVPAARPALDAGGGHAVFAMGLPSGVPPSQTSWLISDLYIDTSTGDDQLHTCVTSGSACKTFAALVALWQTDSQFISGTVTVHLSGALPQSDSIVWHPQCYTTTCNPVILGTATTVASGTLASVTAKNVSASQPWTMNLGGSGYVGRKICNSTHPSCAQVAQLISGTTYLVSQPVDATGFTEVNTWVTGDAFTILQEPSAYFSSLTNVTVDTVWAMQATFFTSVSDTAFVNGRLDDNMQVFGTDSTAIANEYSGGHQSIVLVDGAIEGGFSSSPILSTVVNSGAIENDAIIDTEADITGDGRFGIVSAYSTSGTVWHMGGDSIAVGFGSPGAGPMYGPSYQVDVASGRVVYAVGSPASAVSSFLGGPVLTIAGSAVARTDDVAHNPSLTTSSVTLSPAQLDAARSSGGLDGIALNPGGTFGFYNINRLGAWPTVSPLCNADAGEFMTGWGPTTPCAVPAGGGGSGGAVTSVAGSGAGIAVIPTTGNALVFNLGVTSDLAGAGIGLSGPTGAVTISNTGVRSVTNGTGISTSASTGAITIANTGVTGLTASTGLSASASTGSVTLTNTGVTGASCGTGMSCSSSTGSVLFTNTDPGANVSVLPGTNVTSVTHVGDAWTVNAATQTGTLISTGYTDGSTVGTVALSSASASQITDTVTQTVPTSGVCDVWISGQTTGGATSGTASFLYQLWVDGSAFSGTFLQNTTADAHNAQQSTQFTAFTRATGLSAGSHTFTWKGSLFSGGGALSTQHVSQLVEVKSP